jgi:D-alanine transaminase
MARFAYVNGRFVPHSEAAIHIEDRGFQFADGVYEVITVMGGHFVDEMAHLARLRYSLGEIRIEPPLADRVLKLLMRSLARRNGLRDGILYIQVTRGEAPRDFKFPRQTKSSIVMTTRRMDLSGKVGETGIAVVTTPDIRWARRDIKSIGLLAQVLAKQSAADAGAFEAWMIDEQGLVTEGASSNAWIVTTEGILVTRQTDRSVLHGITGNSIERLAGELGLTVERRPFTLDEALRAREAFLSSATTFCMPIIRIDDQPVANGYPGEITRNLRAAYRNYAQARQDRAFSWPN